MRDELVTWNELPPPQSREMGLPPVTTYADKTLELELVVCPKNDFTLASCGPRVAETPSFRGDCGRRRCRSAEVELQLVLVTHH